MKVQFISTVFHVNEKKRTVTCEMVAKMCNEINNQDNICLTYDGIYRMCSPFKVITVAYCHPDDKFDEVRGKRIAESKAKRLVYSKGREKADKLIRALENCLGEVTRMKNNLESFKKEEIKHTQQLMSAE